MTHITIVILFICPQDESDKEQDAADNRELQHSGHHADTAVAAHERGEKTFNVSSMLSHSAHTLHFIHSYHNHIKLLNILVCVCIHFTVILSKFPRCW